MELTDTISIPANIEPDDITEDELKFVLDSVIDFLEPLKLSGDALSHAGQLLRDVEALRAKL